jgi:hypothetical protein
MWNCAVFPGAAVIGCYAKKILTFFSIWLMKLCQNIIKRKHPKQGRENETWGKDQS